MRPSPFHDATCVRLLSKKDPLVYERVVIAYSCPTCHAHSVSPAHCSTRPPNDPHLITKRPPNDTPGSAQTRAGAQPDSQGIKSIVFPPPSPGVNPQPPWMPKEQPPPEDETIPKRYPRNARNASESASAPPGYQKYRFRTPLAGSHPRSHPGCQRNGPPNRPTRGRDDTQTIPRELARRERERTRKARVSKLLRSHPPSPGASPP